MSTLKNILAKKKSGEIKVKEVDYFESKVLGEKIEVKKKPVSVYMDIVEKYDITESDVKNIIPMANEMIFTFCPMFSNPDDIKEAMEVYSSAAEPLDLPELIFESNLEEMIGIVDVIHSFYNIEEIGEDIKN